MVPGLRVVKWDQVTVGGWNVLTWCDKIVGLWNVVLEWNTDFVVSLEVTWVERLHLFEDGIHSMDDGFVGDPEVASG